MSGKTNADTSQLSHEEIEKHNLHGSKRPPGKSPGNMMHQEGGSGRIRGYPGALLAVAVLAGLGSWAYYRNSHPDSKGQAGTHSPNVQSSKEGSK